MFILGRGLVLRKGERQLEFERDLGDGRVQFKYLDNFEVITISATKVLQDIYDRKLIETNIQSTSRQSESRSDLSILPKSWKKEQLEKVDYCMQFVRAVLRDSSRLINRDVCNRVAKYVWDQMTAAAKSGEISPIKFSCPSGATVELWVRKYIKADMNAYVLVDRRTFTVQSKRIDPIVDGVVNDVLSKKYLSLRGPSVKEVYGEIQRAIEQLNKKNNTEHAAPSERTVNRRVLDIPPYIRDAKRIGPSYAKNKWRYSLTGDTSTRILEKVEIDHALLDIWVIDPRTGVPLGRPWITLLIDRYSGYLLGFYISFYGPSAATVARALKVAILPKDDLLSQLVQPYIRWTAMGVPELLVVDNGLEFHSNQFKRIGWELCCDFVFNPVRQPWFKAAIERAIKESNRVLPRNGRVYPVIKNAVAPNPADNAAIIFDDLCICLIEWASQTYPLSINPKTLCRPWDLWENDRQSYPPAMFPSQLTGLDILCGLNAHRKVNGDGVFFQYLRFNSVDLQDYLRDHHKSFRTEIRFNPDDLSNIFVNLPKEKTWLNVPLQRPLFNDGYGLSLVQLQIIRQELGERLTKSNAYEQMEKAIISLRNQWEDAAQRGLRMRKDAALIRMRGLTSVSLDQTAPLAAPAQESPILLSPVITKALPEVMPFHAFSLADD